MQRVAIKGKGPICKLNKAQKAQLAKMRRDGDLAGQKALRFKHMPEGLKTLALDVMQS